MKIIVILFAVCAVAFSQSCPREFAGKKTAKLWEDTYNMTINIEGGLFHETYRSAETVSQLPLRYGPNATRAMSTHIYYMLREDEMSAFHQLDSDENWHWYYGTTLTLYVIGRDTGELITHYMGPRCGKFVATVQAGDWYAAKLKNPGPGKYALLGINVAPGFEFVDFRFGDKQKLIEEYPQHEALITKMAKNL